MSTTTTNLELVKPEYSDTADVQALNQNADKIDAAVGELQNGFAIIVDGDSAGMAVAPGAYAYIKNNTHGLTEGLYKNKSSSTFPVSGGTANSTVFETAPGGGLNALNTRIVGGISSISATDDTNTITVPRDGIYLVSLVGQKQSAAVGVHKILINNAFLIGAVTNDKEQFVNISFPVACHRNDVISFSTTVPFISNYADYMSYLMIAYITPAS